MMLGVPALRRSAEEPLHRVRDTLARQIRCAVQVPEHMAPRQVPDPDVAVRRPEPTARFMPLLSVTLMVPAFATWPEAVTAASLEAT